MRKQFMIIFGLLLVAFCYHSPPIPTEVSNDINYDLPGLSVDVPIIHTVLIEGAPAIIKGPLYEVRGYNTLDEYNVYATPNPARVSIKENETVVRNIGNEGKLSQKEFGLTNNNYARNVYQTSGFSEQGSVNCNELVTGKIMRELSKFPSSGISYYDHPKVNGLSS